jgi:hypothetical protein
MSQEVFSGAAWIEIQGERPMTLVRLNKKYATYKVTGFKHPIVIHDYRKKNLPIIRKALKLGNATGFAVHFNKPAHVQIQRQKPSRLMIRLHDITDQDPPYRLWIVDGVGNQLPAYDYVFERLARLADERFALFAVYRRGKGDMGLESASSVS